MSVHVQLKTVKKLKGWYVLSSFISSKQETHISFLLLDLYSDTISENHSMHPCKEFNSLTVLLQVCRRGMGLGS